MNELIELGKRVRQERVAAAMKQQELADRAAVSKDTLSALENGRPVSTEKLARILRSLGHADALENILPPPVVSPLDLQKLAGKPRQRVR
jgi:transcriptional regulator with XRE-family HTH domain